MERSLNLKWASPFLTIIIYQDLFILLKKDQPELFTKTKINLKLSQKSLAVPVWERLHLLGLRLAKILGLQPNY